MSNQLVHNLKKIFPQHQFGNIIRALRGDQIIWRAFQDPNVTNQMLDLAGTQVDRWSPAFLAMVVLGIPERYEALKSWPEPLDEKIKYEAAKQLETLTGNAHVDLSGFSIEEAGMAALALRERWIILKQHDTSLYSEHHNNALWKPIIAILIGLLPKPEELVQAMLVSNAANLRSLAIHAISTNPFSDDTLTKILLPSVKILPTIERIEVLRQCSQTNPNLAVLLASKLISQFDLSEQSASKNPIEMIQEFVELSELLKITGKYEEAIPTLEKLWRTTTSLQTDLTAQLAKAAAKANRQDAAIEAIDKIFQIEDHLQPDDRANIALAQIHTGQIGTEYLVHTQATHNPSSSNPAALIANAQLSLKNSKQTEAQNLANQAFEITRNFLQNQDLIIGNISSAINADTILTLINLLIDLELVIEAGILCELAITKLPNNDEIVALYCKAATLSGDINLALENAHIAIALNPDNTFYRQTLIKLLRQENKWEEALKETEDYLNMLDSPNSEDHHLLATCYLFNNQLDRAAEAAKKGLVIAPDNGELHSLLASIYKSKKEYNESIKHLNKAILLEPQIPDYWSSLSNLYMLQENPDKALEILHSAFEVNPQNAHLHLQLGKRYQELGKQGEALAEFQKAKEFVNPETGQDTRQEIFVQLGRELFMQGYRNDSMKVLEEGHQAFPVNPEIAHLFGKALFHEGRYAEAVSAYQIASQKASPNIEMLLDYSEVLLAVGNKTETALGFIKKVLDADPQNPVGIARLAEATAQTGDHTQAIKIYQQAMQSDLAGDRNWQADLSTKIAESAFALNQPEVAIAFLQETLQLVPENLKVKQKLCQAYMQTDLIKDALKLLDEILESNAQNLEILMWAADQAMIISNLELAAEILNKAKQLSPQKADILVRLGYIQLESGDEELARKTFGQLFAAENVDVNNLRLAAQALIGLGDISSSIPYLEKALEISDYKSSDLLNELTKLHRKSGNYDAALETIKKQIKIQPLLPLLYVTQADIYFQLAQPKAALNSMLKALELAPDSAKLHAKTAYLLRKNHDLPGSLFHIKQAASIDDQDQNIKLQAAQIFSACLLTEGALELSKEIAQQEKPTLAACLLLADLILDEPLEEHVESVDDLLSLASELSPSHPRVLAIQSRLAYLKGDQKASEEAFEQAMLNLAASDADELEPINLGNINLSIAKTAITLKRWDIALFFAREAQQLTPTEPWPYFLQAVTFTLRAEDHYRSKAIQKHDKFPSVIATHQVSQDAFSSAIESAEAYTPDPEAGRLLARWRARGELALLGKSPTEYYDILSETPADFAAFLAAVRQADLVPDFDLTIHHQDIEVLFEKALLNYENDPENAFSLAQELVKLGPNNPEYAALYAILAQNTGQILLALHSIEHALVLLPDEPNWHAFAGELNLKLGRAEAGITHFERALRYDQDNPDYLYKLGIAYLAGNSPGNAIRVLEEATKIEPLETKYWSSLAEAYNRTENSSYAFDAIKQALKLSPNNLSTLICAAEIAVGAGEQKYAEKLVEKVISLPSKSSDEIIRTSELMIAFDHSDSAIKYLEEKIELAVDKVAIQIQRAKLIGEQKGNQAKLELLIALAKDYPQNPLVFAHVADAYIEAKNSDEAIRAAQFALKHANGLLDIQMQTKLHYQLGVLLRQSGQLDQALHQLSQALNLSPNFLAGHLEIGETLSQRKEFAQALEHFQKAIEISPRDPRPYKEAGLLLKESKDYAAAEAMFRQAYALDSNDIFIQRQLATARALAIIHQPNANRSGHGKS